MSQMPLGVVLSVNDSFADRLRRIEEAGFPTMQLSRPPDEWLAEPRRSELKRLISDSGVTVTSVAAIYAGESYADVETVRRTVGLLPQSTRSARIEDTKLCADFTHEVGAPNVSSHIGYIPEDRAEPDYEGLASAVREICDHLEPRRMNFCLETGQETADLLKQFIADVGRDNLKVNFDPANMIMYGTGDPIAALSLLAPWVRGVHCKDGEWPEAAGRLGGEKPLGQGQVGVERFIAKLKDIGYEGPLTIEREVSGEEQMRGFFAAKRLLEEVKARLGID
ncbi:MAG: sugar phosphate isomerase/epimerase [Armatimonadota bacterium]|nr:MAG: sugar phosphate isomerase/epimerase [Armatimonadota bacterium]